MSLISYKLGQQSIVLRVKCLASNVTTGAGLTGLTFESAGLIISTIADNEATATPYAVADENVETIATLGTFSAPTAGKCRFAEVDATNHPGVYEIQIANARYAVANAKSLLVSLSGATNLAQTDAVIPLTSMDFYSATVDVGAISGDSTAADNLEAMLDGTGGVALNLGKVTVSSNDGSESVLIVNTGTGDALSLVTQGAGKRSLRLTGVGVASKGIDIDVAGDPIYIMGLARYLLSANDDGATAVMRTGADSDTGETLSDQLDAITPGGPTLAEQTAAFTEIKGATWSAGTDTLEHLRDKLPPNLEDLSITDTTGLVKANDASGNAVATAATQTTQGSTLTTIAANVAGLDGASIPTDYAKETTAQSILEDTGTTLPAAIPTAAAIAQAVMVVDLADVEASAPAYSLCTKTLAAMNGSISSGTLTVYRTDGETEHATATVTSDAYGRVSAIAHWELASA